MNVFSLYCYIVTYKNILKIFLIFSYSLYDPSYCNKESFGFFADVGNGYTTLVPSFLYLFCMITKSPIVEPQIMGVIGILKFYQEFYGTVIYFLSYIPASHRMWRAPN